MGLDMSLYGDKSSNNNETVDGFPLSNLTLDLGYWRKHANLHGFIVKVFAEGVDECQRIHLDEKDLENIIDALESDALYEDGEVTGFFFGRSYFPGESDQYGSYDEQKTRDINVFKKALEWVRNATPASGKWGEDNYKWPEWRSVYYQASW